MFCTNCGKQQAPGILFCTNCGIKMNPGTSTKRGKKWTVIFTLLAVLLLLSLAGNALLWQVYSTEYDKAVAAQTISSTVSDVQSGLCTKVGDYAISEHELSGEMFRMLGDCYEGLPPRESDFGRLSEKVTQVGSDWASIEQYINSISGAGDASTTTN